MANEKNLPEISGDETISSTWRRLLDRDRNISNLFSGDSFTSDQKSNDIGRPNWRTDLNRLFIYNGTEFISLWKYLTPQEIEYSIEHPDVPEDVNNIKAIIDLLVNRNMLNTITMPAVSQKYMGNGTTNEFELERYTSNKNTLYIFIDGVKQACDTYELSSDGMKVLFNRAPSNGESVEILQMASLLEYDYSPVIKTFTGDGTTTEFDFGQDILNPVAVSVNVDDAELQKSKFSIMADGRTVKLITPPSEGAVIQITTVNKTSYVTVSASSIGTTELKDKSVTIEKLADNLPIDINSIPEGSITSAMLKNGSVDSAKILDNSIISSKIVNGAITKDKLAESISSTLLGTENVKTANLASKSVTKDKLGDDVLTILNNLESRLASLEGA